MRSRTRPGEIRPETSASLSLRSDRDRSRSLLYTSPMPTAKTAEPNDVLDFCCGARKCPVLRRETDAIVIADPDQTAGEIRLTREQVVTAMPWLAEWVSGK